MHTYSMRDSYREKFVFYIAISAITVFPVTQYATGFFGFVPLVTAYSLFAGLYCLFDRWAWKQNWLSWLVNVPNLSGTWTISGETNGADGTPRQWQGNAIIKQTWSQIAISLETIESRSRSLLAAIERDPGQGYRMIYGYENRRKGLDTNIRGHFGTCEVIVADDLQTAEGCYFNDHQRHTFGSMKWTRQSINKE